MPTENCGTAHDLATGVAAVTILMAVSVGARTAKRIKVNFAILVTEKLT